MAVTGCKDYITNCSIFFKSIFLELIARVKAQLRRYTKFTSFQQSNDELFIRGLYLNKKTKEVKLDDKPVRLTPIEFKILQLLMENPDIIFSIQEIYEKVWNEPFINSENTVAVHIRRIREKIEVDPKEPMYLKVVWGIGYQNLKIRHRRFLPYPFSFTVRQSLRFEGYSEALYRKLSPLGIQVSVGGTGNSQTGSAAQTQYSSHPQYEESFAKAMRKRQGI